MQVTCTKYIQAVGTTHLPAIQAALEDCAVRVDWLWEEDRAAILWVQKDENSRIREENP